MSSNTDSEGRNSAALPPLVVVVVGDVVTVETVVSVAEELFSVLFSTTVVDAVPDLPINSEMDFPVSEQ